MKTLEGIIRISRGGTGFIDREGAEESIRIPTERLGLALNKDKVVVSLETKPRVLKVLERNKIKFTGTLEKSGKKWFAAPDDKRIHLDFFIKEIPAGAGENMKVLIKFLGWDNPEKNPEAEILEIIGRKGEHQTEMKAILLNRGIEEDFPPDVLKEAEKIKREISKEEIKKRLDFRKITTFTIDPFDAKDFDDAISFEEYPDGNFKLGVHIADVSHYVGEKTKLDGEARKRGFSVYLVDRTIPMLPEVLSNDVCSLNPKEDKLTFSAVFEFDKNGRKKNHWIGKTIINSDKRFTYEAAQEILDKKEGLFYKELKIMNTLAQKMHRGRVERGSILFDRDEIKIELDKDGKPLKIYKKKRLETHKLIEEFMLLANREVTEHIEKHCKKAGLDKLFVYRIHDLPNEEKLAELAVFLKAFGYNLNLEGGVDPKEINRLIKEVEGKPEEELVKTSLVRSMAKAEYSTKNIGHFGLAFNLYTHFTSPIRRYADLLVHRLLYGHLKGEAISKSEIQKYQKMSLEASRNEITAAEAERESKKYKTVEFMQSKVGQTLSGIISGVTDWGLYVQDKETGAEGLVKLSSLRDDYYKTSGKYRVEGTKKKKKFQLGDEVKIKLIKASLNDKELDFVFAN